MSVCGREPPPPPAGGGSFNMWPDLWNLRHYVKAAKDSSHQRNVRSYRLAESLSRMPVGQLVHVAVPEMRVARVPGSAAPAPLMDMVFKSTKAGVKVSCPPPRAAHRDRNGPP